MKLPENEPLIVLLTIASAQDAEYMAEVLVREKLAAGITSIYLWQGAVRRDKEALMVIKTCRPLLEGLTRQVQALHSYKPPEIIAVPIVTDSPAHLHWLADSTPSP